MTTDPSDASLFAKLVVALEPYLDAVVVVGGWAHKLHAHHEAARSLDFLPLMTEDADVAAPLDLAVRDESIRERLRAHGFMEELRGEDRPPIAHYHLGHRAGGFYVEFLAPQRRGEPKHAAAGDTATVAGVPVQKLPFLDLLLLEPWAVRLANSNGYPLGEGGFVVLVANPVTFVAQKLLVLGARPNPGKEILYVHDTLQLFSASLESHLRPCFLRVQNVIANFVVERLHEVCRGLFTGVTDPIRSASRIATLTGRPDPPTVERVAATCSTGLSILFGWELT